MDDLAQELIDQIIDCWNLAEKDAMGPCGLVCKIWLPRSRYHLFSRVSVNTRNLQSFVDVVESSSSPILTFIQHLKFEYGILDTEALARLHPCPNLASIHIAWGPYKEGTWPDAYTALKTNLRSWNDECSSSLSRLVLTDVAGLSPFLPLPMATEVISCVPGIATLEIRRINIVRGGITETFPPPPPLSRLEDLLLVPFEGCILFFSWLCALPIPPTLRSLEISTFIEDGYGEGEGADEGEDESKALAAYFRQAGTGLQTLNINLLSGHLFPEFERRILQYTPNLRYLQFKAF
ncbi:hypothetical protein B0H13DRAFT_2073157, partial [Mycena leptocephala]